MKRQRKPHAHNAPGTTSLSCYIGCALSNNRVRALIVAFACCDAALCLYRWLPLMWPLSHCSVGCPVLRWLRKRI